MVIIVADYLGANPLAISSIEQVLWEEWIMAFDVQDGHHKVPTR